MHELHEGRARGVACDDERRGERVSEREKTAVERRGNATAKGGKVADDCDELKDIDRKLGWACEVTR